MSIINWSTTAASNNSAPPNGWPENMAPSQVNDVGRQMMADIRSGVQMQVDSKTALSAILAADVNEGDRVYMKYRTTDGDGGGGTFRVTKTNISTNVTADTQGGVYVPFDSDSTGASGGFIREYTGLVAAAWFGAAGANTTTDYTTAMQAAIDYLSSTFISSPGGFGGDLFFRAGQYLYTGLVVKEGVSLVGEGSTKTIFLLSGATATGLKSVAATTQAVADQVSFGAFKGISLISNEATPSSQIQWNMTGFSRWSLTDVFFQWFGGCTGISMLGATPAGSGGPAQWYNSLYDCFLINPASKPAGGVAVDLGDASTTFEQVTAFHMFGGRISSADNTGTGLGLRGSGNSFNGVAFEGLGIAIALGSAGTRGAWANSFNGCYLEGNTTNRKIYPNVTETTWVPGLITGGVDDIAPDTMAFNVGPTGLTFQDKADGTGTTTKEIFDYYKEGDWTPVISDAATGGNLSPTVFSGQWTRIGRVVHLTARCVNIDTTGMTSGNILFIQNVPFISAGSFENTGSVIANSVTLSNNNIYPNIAPGATVITFLENITGGNVGTIKVSDLTSGTSDLHASITYNV